MLPIEDKFVRSFPDTPAGFREYNGVNDEIRSVVQCLNNFIPAYINRREPFMLISHSEIFGSIKFRFSPVGSDNWGVTCESMDKASFRTN